MSEIPRWLLVINVFRHVWGTTAHKVWVLWYCLSFAGELVRRGLVHDLSKFSRIEAQTFIRQIHLLKGQTYGSKAYEKTQKRMEGLINHYQQNRHHPEHSKPNNPSLEGMNLVDLVEMFCDWRAAVKRHKNGNIAKSIEINRKRFSIPKTLCTIFRNTATDAELRRNQPTEEICECRPPRD